MAFRVDASAMIGSGHLVRCLTLADALRGRGASCAFVTAPLSGRLGDRLADAGHEHHVLTNHVPDQSSKDDAAATVRALNDGVDVLVVDHYRLDHRWERAVAGAAEQVVAIDDLADRDHAADVLLDQNWSGHRTATRYDQRAPDAELLLGPRYALLQPVYAQLRAVSLQHRDATDVLVTFGGTDPTGENARVLAAATDVGRPIHLVLGAAADEELVERQARGLDNVTTYRDLPSLAPLLSEVGMVIGAGGTSTWERVCLGVPTVTVTVADNQVEVTRALARAGLVEWLGHGGEVTVADYRNVLSGPTPAPPRSLVDGHGADRVALRLLPPGRPEVAVREATDLDRPLLTGPADPRHPDCYLRGPAIWEQWSARAAAAKRRLIVEVDDVPLGAGLLEGPTLHWWIDPGAPTGVRGVITEELVRASGLDALAVVEVTS